MLGIVFGILKWLGIVILVLLVLVLAVFLAVLFVPIRYGAEGSFREELLAKGEISWLCHLFSCQAIYDRDMQVSLRIFGVKLGRKKRKADVKEEAQLSESEFPESEEHSETEAPVSDRYREAEEPVREDVPDAEVPKEPERETSRQEKSGAGPEENQRQPEKEKEAAKRRQKKKPIGQSPFQKIKATFQRNCGKLKTAEEKWQKFREFLEKEENKNTFRLLKRQIFRFLKHILPGRVSGNIRFGFEDPYTTGKILTCISPFYGWYGKNVQIIPVFDEQVLEGEIVLKGRIRIATLLFIGFQVWQDKNFRTLLKQWQAA